MSENNDGFNPMKWFGENIDDPYSKSIRESFKAPTEKRDLNIGEIAHSGAASFLGVPRQADKLPDGYNNPGGKFVHTAGQASRYALPSLGVTAAGIALADLAGYFGGSPDQPEEGQLGLNNGEMSALGLIAAAPLLAGGAAAGMGLFGGEETAGNEQVESGRREAAEASEIGNQSVAKEVADRPKRRR